MKKGYYYLLFRLFHTLSDPKKGNDSQTINYLTTTTSTLVLFIIFLTTVLYIDEFCFSGTTDLIIPDSKIAFLYIVCLGVLNYSIFVKKRPFLNYNFKPDQKGGYSIMVFLILLACAFMFVANIHREKILMP